MKVLGAIVRFLWEPMEPDGSLPTVRFLGLPVHRFAAIAMVIVLAAAFVLRAT
jgi:hypothetical protein